MARPTTKSDQKRTEAMTAIVRAAVDQLQAGPATRVTIESVAAAAGCAKGLVHYHFKTKDNLLSAAARHIWDDRTSAWKTALDGPDPAVVIGAAWSLLTKEGSRGVSAAAATLGMDVGEMVGQTVRTARQRFVLELGEAADSFFRRMGLRPTVQTAEIALLLVAVIDGLGLQVASGTPAGSLEPAWAAFWAGVLSLTRPA